MRAVMTSVEGLAHAGRLRDGEDRRHRATLPVLLTVD